MNGQSCRIQANAIGGGGGRESRVDRHMSDKPFVVTGSAAGTFIVVNQIKEHYLAAVNLQAGDLDRTGFKFWMVGQALDACSKTIENAIDRLRRQRRITRGKKEKLPEFRMRVCREACLVIGMKADSLLETLRDHWNAHKHSADSVEWKEFTNLRTPSLTIDSFHLTTAFLAACYQLFDNPERPDWLRQAKAQDGEIVVSPLTIAEIDHLLATWEISISSPNA